MIREAILTALKEQKISQRRCALKNNINYNAFNNFLNNRRPMPVHDIEKVLKYLGLKIRPDDEK
jgi:transcriptional regulator with XRE-family HTH domain